MRLSLLRVTTAVAAIGFLSLPIVAQEARETVRPAGPVVAPQQTGRISGLARRIRSLADQHEGDVAVAVVHLGTGESFYRNPDEPMPTASLIKLAVMIEAYRQANAGLISLDDEVTLKKEDKVPGSGILTPHFTPGAKMTVRDAIRLMMAFSDNTATNLVVDQVGLANVNETMRSLGCPDTSMHAKVFRGDTSIAPERSRKYGLGSITARQAVSLLSRIHRKELYDAAACDAMLADLASCDDKIKVRRGLPPNTKWAHKTGSVNAVRTDAGLLETPSGTVALCILTANNKDTGWNDDNAGDTLLSEIGRAIYESFSRGPSGRRIDSRTPSGPLAMGTNGPIVEALQRSLNAALAPPGVTVDGDFGAQTKEALERFQREKGLEVTGIADAATWRALGPARLEEQPVPSPEEIAKAAAELKVAPPDDPNGPPYVTAKAWAIGDAATGEILWHFNGETPRDMASTTKIMTAFIVLELAAKDPAVLDEIVTFSERADNTSGSTAAVRVGEKVSVRELMYGLLLPSGNDASVAFAEHFGPRLEPPSAEELPEGADPGDPLENFVAEMNRTAKRLGLSATGFRNPHGLTARGHQTSPADLIRLAIAALKHDLFREVISTRLHGAVLAGEGGYTRNIRWENTNQLLGISGFEGVKTGTTDAAGACLVSMGTAPSNVAGGALGDRKLIITVLGSTSADGRYADTKNLYRWAWQQLAEKSVAAAGGK